MSSLPLGSREFVSIAMIFVAVVVAVWGQRRRLRPSSFIVTGAIAVVSGSASAYLFHGARAGEFTGWGGLVLVLVLLPAVLFAVGSITALVMMTAILPFYGFDTRTREQRRVERRVRRSWAGQYLGGTPSMNLVMIGIALVMLAVRYNQLRAR